MTSAAGLPRTPPQRPPMRRGVRELIIAVAALPLLVATGVYFGLHAGDSSAQGRTTAASTPSPLVTVEPAAPKPVVTVEPAAPKPVVTVEPPAPGPVVTVEPAGPPPPTPAVLLARGSVGPDVRAWQEQMARRTWRIRVDGIFGRQTRSVVRRFQREKGLVVDGIVGPRTWAAAWRLPVTR